MFVFTSMMILFMPSLHDATEAAKYVQGIREELNIHILQPDEDIGQDMVLFN